jgi:hypothetical protein
MQFNFPTKPFEDKEQDLYSYSLIRQEMDAADTETGNQPGDIVGGSLQPFDDARSKKIMAFANELERGGLAHIKKMDGESVDFIVLRDSAFPKIDYLVQKYGLLPTDQAKQTKQQRQKQDQEKTQEFQRQNQLAAQQQLGIEPTQMQQQQMQQQGGGMGGGMAAMLQQMMGGGGGQPQQQKINPQDPTARDQDPRSQGMLSMQKKMVQGGLTPVKRPDAKGLGLQKQTEVPRFEATIIFRGPYHLKGDEIVKDVRDQFKMMFGGASNKADGTFTMDLSFHDQETANDVLGYIQKRHGSEIIDIITSRLNTNIPGYGRYKQQQGQQMSRFDPRSAIGEEHAKRLRIFEEAMRNTGRGLRLRYPEEEDTGDTDNPYYSPDYTTDSDGDGVPDWYEIAMETDPNDPNDFPETPTMPEPGEEPPLLPPDFVPGFDPLSYPDFTVGGQSPGTPRFPNLDDDEERGMVDQMVFEIIFLLAEMGIILLIPGGGLMIAGAIRSARLAALVKKLLLYVTGALEVKDFLELLQLLQEIYKLAFKEKNPLDAPQDPDLSKEPKLPTLTRNPIELPSDTPPPTQPFGPGGNNPLP